MRIFIFIVSLFLFSFSHSSAKNNNIETANGFWQDVNGCINVMAYSYQPNGSVDESITVEVCSVDGSTINSVNYNGSSVFWQPDGNRTYVFSLMGRGYFYFNY